MIPAALLLVLNLLLVIRPQVFAAPSDRARARRLEQIRAGDPERFFEEGRALVGYQRSSQFLLLWRVLGAVGAAACLFLLADLSGLLAG
jgi:hypothetical protein